MSAELKNGNGGEMLVDEGFMNTFRQLLKEHCLAGNFIELKLDDIRGHLIVTTKIQKVFVNELNLITDQLYKASKPFNIDPGTKVKVSLPIEQGEMIFDLILSKTSHMPAENHFKISPVNVLIRKRQYPRIDAYCEGSIIDSRQRVILSMLTPLKSTFSQSGIRIWLETGNLNVNTVYTVALRLTYSQKDLNSPKLKVDCDWHVIEVKLYGDGVKEPFNYQAAGFFKNHEQSEEMFNDYVQKYQSYKALNDINRFRTTR